MRTDDVIIVPDILPVVVTQAPVGAPGGGGEGRTHDTPLRTIALLLDCHSRTKKVLFGERRHCLCYPLCSGRLSSEEPMCDGFRHPRSAQQWRLVFLLFFPLPFYSGNIPDDIVCRGCASLPNIRLGAEPSTRKYLQHHVKTAHTTAEAPHLSPARYLPILIIFLHDMPFLQ